MVKHHHRSTSSSNMLAHNVAERNSEDIAKAATLQPGIKTSSSLKKSVSLLNMLKARFQSPAVIRRLRSRSKEVVDNATVTKESNGESVAKTHGISGFLTRLSFKNKMSRDRTPCLLNATVITDECGSDDSETILKNPNFSDVSTSTVDNIDTKYEEIKAKYGLRKTSTRQPLLNDWTSLPNNFHVAQDNPLSATKQSTIKISCLLNGYGALNRPCLEERTLFKFERFYDISPLSNKNHVNRLQSKEEENNREEINGNSCEIYDYGSTPTHVLTNGCSHCDRIGQTATNVMNQIKQTFEENMNGKYFLQKLEIDTNILRKRCEEYEKELTSELPEDAKGNIQAAIGKTRLLLSQKMEQFKTLCHQNLNPSENHLPTTNADLAGFWDMLAIQIEECKQNFDALAEMKANNWQNQNITVKNVSKTINKKKICHKPPVPPTTTTSRSDALRKIMQDQRNKMRLQNNSKSPNGNDITNVEIFVNESKN